MEERGTTIARRVSWPSPTLLAMTLAMTGTGICLRYAEAQWAAPHLASVVFIMIGAAFAVAVGLGYLLRGLRDFAAVHAEFVNPQEACLFCGWSISMLLLGGDASQRWPAAGIWLWYAGIAAHVAVTVPLLRVGLRAWTHRGRQAAPSWLMPSTGYFFVPVYGIAREYLVLSWICFAIGLLLWVLGLHAWLARLRVSGRPSAALAPQLLIIVAPPSVGAIAWLRLAGEASVALEALLFVLLAAYMATALQLLRMRRDCRFTLTWWATVFPSAALTSFALVLSSMTHSKIFTAVGGILLLMLGAIIGTLLVLSMFHVREIRQRIVAATSADTVHEQHRDQESGAGGGRSRA